MDFQNFINSISTISSETLPASEAHKIMAPAERVDLMNVENFENVNPREAAVMMLFYPKNSITHLVLILRNSYNGVHSSQIAFPGGKVERSDISYEHTALRETEEEIGISPEKIRVMRSFSKIYIPPSNFMVHPFLGYSVEELVFVADPSEVAGIIELPLSDFLNEENIVSKRMSTSYSPDVLVPAFEIQGHFVWGATAMMLSELKETLKKVL